MRAMRQTIDFHDELCALREKIRDETTDAHGAAEVHAQSAAAKRGAQDRFTPSGRGAEKASTVFEAEVATSDG
jgi:hypothetical protein